MQLRLRRVIVLACLVLLCATVASAAAPAAGVAPCSVPVSVLEATFHSTVEAQRPSKSPVSYSTGSWTAYTCNYSTGSGLVQVEVDTPYTAGNYAEEQRVDDRPADHYAAVPALSGDKAFVFIADSGDAGTAFLDGRRVLVSTLDRKLSLSKFASLFIAIVKHLG